MDAHADAVARAKAIAARLAGLSSVAAPAVPGGGHYSHPPAAPPPSSSTSGAPDAADVSAMLDAALGGGGGGGGGGEGIDQQHPDLSRKRGVEAALASLIPGLGTTYSDSSSKRPRGAGDGGGATITSA